jgi:hypothetical protein
MDHLKNEREEIKEGAEMRGRKTDGNESKQHRPGDMTRSTFFAPGISSSPRQSLRKDDYKSRAR